MSLSRSLDLPALDKVDTLAQELALLQDKGKRRIAILGGRHVPIVAIHLVELIADPWFRKATPWSHPGRRVSTRQSFAAC